MSEIRLEAQDLNQQAASLLKAGNPEAAKAKLDKAIEIDPMLMDSYKNYGDLYMSTGKYEDAKNSYKKAILIEKNGALYFLYGNACFMNDEVHEGLEYYNLAISSGYDSDEMMFFMGMAYEHLNDDHMAFRYFQKACTKNPSRPDFAIKKIHVMLRLNMMDEATVAVDELIATSPELYDGYHLKTHLLIHKGEAEKALSFAKEATERFPEDADLMVDYARCIAINKKLDEALQVIAQAKKMKYFDDAKRAFTILEAEVAAEANKYDYAIECCENCISMESESGFDGEARFMLMNLYLAKPDYATALEQAKALVANDAEDMYYYAALYYRAFCTAKMDNAEEAKKFYKEANSIYRLATLKRPEAIDVYLYRAMCLKDMEEYDKAMEILDFILGLSLEVAEVYMLKGEIYRIQGRKSQSDEELQKAYKIKPELNPNRESAGE